MIIYISYFKRNRKWRRNFKKLERNEERDENDLKEDDKLKKVKEGLIVNYRSFEKRK